MKFSFSFVAVVIGASQVMSLPMGELEERTNEYPAPPYMSLTTPYATSTTAVYHHEPTKYYPASNPPTTYPHTTKAPVYTPPAETPKYQECAPASKAMFLLRGYSSSASDHFYTTNVAEMNHATSMLGYKKESHAAKVFTMQQKNTIPLYRLYSKYATDHFYTTSEAEAQHAAYSLGYTREGVAAYVYASQICGSIPLYRLYNSYTSDHFYTTSQPEAHNAAYKLGYKDEGIAGYVLPAH